MEYAELVEVYGSLEGTSASLEKTAILAEAFADVADQDASADPLANSGTGREGDAVGLLGRVVRLVRGTVFAPWEAGDLGVSTSLTVDAIETATGVDPDTVEDWWRETGDLGDAAARAIEQRSQRALFADTLTVESVYDTLRELATYEGEGSQGRRVDELAGLLSNADANEARYLVRTVVGAMRLGIGDGTVRDAIAQAFLDGEARDGDDPGDGDGPDEQTSGTAADAVERAYQVTNDYALVAWIAHDAGREGLAALDVELFRPVQVMLARKAEGIADGVESVAPEPGDVLAEYKYDGVRTQLHVDGDDVRVYTRRLEDVTPQFPDVVDAVRGAVAADAAILEGEIVGYDPDTGDPVPFQRLSRRIKRKYDVDELAAEIPVVVHLFDALAVDGETLLDASLDDRLAALDDAVADDDGTIERTAHRYISTDGDDPASVDGAVESLGPFYQEALDAGHEGLMLKNRRAAYQPGSRVGYVMKVKPLMEPLDLVVTRAKSSEGRRSDFLGRLYLACRDSDTGELLEVGRVSTGFTDEELADVTDRLEPHVTGVDGRDVQIEPAVVLQIAYEEIQESPEYGSGYALRFPRFEGFRDDLGPDDADTLERVEALYDGQ